MPNIQSRDNLNRWIDGAEIDYFTYFIRAWIPFNAWYKQSFVDIGDGSDRSIINHIKSSSNEIRNTIHNYLERSGAVNDIFKSYLANLHVELGQTTIENDRVRISFENIVIETNSKNNVDLPIRGINYFINRTDGPRGKVLEMKTVLKNASNTTIFHLTQPNEYNLQNLLENSNFRALSESQRNITKGHYEALNPYKPINLIVPDRLARGRNYYECSEIKFLRDESNTLFPADSMCKSIIEILYRLRNVLFHGELNPTGDCNKVYMNAYHILKMLIDRIR